MIDMFIHSIVKYNIAVCSILSVFLFGVDCDMAVAGVG